MQPMRREWAWPSHHALLHWFVAFSQGVVWTEQGLPAVQLYPVSQFGQLVRQPPLLNDALRADGHLAQGERVGRLEEAKLGDRVGNHLLGRGVFADDNVTTLLVRLEHTDNLVWNIFFSGQ